MFKYKSMQECFDALEAVTKTVNQVNTELGEANDVSKVTSLTGTPEEKFAAYEKLLTEQASYHKELKVWKKRAKAEERATKMAGKVDFRAGQKGSSKANREGGEFQKSFAIPAKARAWKSRETKDERMSYAAGQWALATWGEKAGRKGVAEKAQQWCNEHLNMKALDENFNETGGALVPYEFLPILVDLKEQYGKVRRNMNIIPMSRDVMPFPRRNAHVSATWVTNNMKPSESAPTFNNIELVAKKLFSWIAIPYELIEDSAIAIGDWVMKDMAWAFSKAEDDAFLLGDGTETYGQVTGVKKSLLNLDSTIANIAGIQVASTKTWGSMTKTDIAALMGRLPGYALETAKFYCSSSFYFNVLQRLLYSQGGSPGAELRDSLGGNGNKTLTYLYNGIEVVICQNLPMIPDQVSDMVLYFGDLNLAGKFADRRQFTVATSTEVLFLNDQLAIKATERIALAVHDVGNATATAADRVAGPIVALITPTA